MSSQTWLTQEAADRLRAELENLEGVGRKEITAKIEAAATDKAEADRLVEASGGSGKWNVPSRRADSWLK